MSNLELSKEAERRCICCERGLGPAWRDGEPWEGPSGAICFLDTGNFGSTLNDSAYDGHRLEVMICDECLTTKRHLVREYETPGYADARDARSRENVQQWLAALDGEGRDMFKSFRFGSA